MDFKVFGMLEIPLLFFWPSWWVILFFSQWFFVGLRFCAGHQQIVSGRQFVCGKATTIKACFGYGFHTLQFKNRFTLKSLKWGMIHRIAYRICIHLQTRDVQSPDDWCRWILMNTLALKVPQEAMCFTGTCNENVNGRNDFSIPDSLQPMVNDSWDKLVILPL